MQHVVFRYLQRLRKNVLEDYLNYSASYTGRSQVLLMRKKEREQFLSNVIFQEHIFEEPKAEATIQEEFENPVKTYAGFLFKEYEVLRNALKILTSPEEFNQALKTIGDLTAILFILRFHFTAVPFDRYNKNGIWYRDATDEELDKLGWSWVQDPKDWNFLPISVINNILESDECVQVNRKITPVYYCLSEVVKDFLLHLCDGFNKFYSDVYLSQPAFESFQGILQHNEAFRVIQNESKGTCKEIHVIVYPEYMQSIKLKMRFEQQKDSTWRLLGCTRFAGSSVGEKERGFFVDRSIENDSLFSECTIKKYRFPIAESIIYID